MQLTDEQIKKSLQIGGESVDEINKRLTQIEKDALENQKILDSVASNDGSRNTPYKQKTLSDLIVDQLQERKSEVDEFVKNKHNRLTLEIKDTMTTATSLTGDPQRSYSSQPAISPRHLTNFRDLIPTVQSRTGSFITYREGTVTNGFALQTENTPKGVQNYTWSEQIATAQYQAATTKVTKQLMYNLPFLQSTLTQQLLRDFYKKENDYFYVLAAAAALGSNYTAATVDAEQVIDMIANQIAASFNPSFVLVHPTEWARILKTKPSDYSIPAGVVINAQGQTTIAGTPVIPVPWSLSDKVLVIDADQIERAEVESLRVEFAFQNEDDFINNRVCVRCECLETLNIKRPESLIYLDMGNS